MLATVAIRMNSSVISTHNCQHARKPEAEAYEETPVRTKGLVRPMIDRAFMGEEDSKLGSSHLCCKSRVLLARAGLHLALVMARDKEKSSAKVYVAFRFHSKSTAFPYSPLATHLLLTILSRRYSMYQTNSGVSEALLVSCALLAGTA